MPTFVTELIDQLRLSVPEPKLLTWLWATLLQTEQ